MEQEAAARRIISKTFDHGSNHGTAEDVASEGHDIDRLYVHGGIMKTKCTSEGSLHGFLDALM